MKSTPAQLRAAQLLVVAVFALAGLVGVFAAVRRVTLLADIRDRTEPLNKEVIEVYRSLADADATAAAEFLETARPEIDAARDRGAEDLGRAMVHLTAAGRLAGEGSLTTQRIGEIARQVVPYSALIERARTRRDAGLAPAGELASASDLMQSTILRSCESLQRAEAARLAAQYREARSVPAGPLGTGMVALVTVVAVQIFLTRKTRRLVNVGTAAATAALLLTAWWWRNALAESTTRLTEARRHSQAIAGALSEAQIAARRARTAQLLAAVPGSPVRGQVFADKVLVLGPSGAGGALGVTRHLASNDQEQQAADRAVAAAEAWLNASPATAGPAFDALDAALSAATRARDEAFTAEIGAAGRALRGFAPATGGVLLAASLLGAWGLALRLQEYR